MTPTAALVISFVVGAAEVEAATQQLAPPGAAKARELIRRLGAQKFPIRDAAEKELVRLGVACLDALKEGEKNPDLHIQERCRQLQPVIRALTLQKRIDAFLTNRDGPLPDNLPFVRNFIKLTGDSKEARALFAEMLQSNAQLLDEAERDKKKGADLFAAFCQDAMIRTQYIPGVDFRARQNSITRADLALFFLLTTELKNDTTGRISNFGYTFMNAPVLVASLSKETTAIAPFKKLFFAWLDKEPQPYLVQRGIQIAADAKLKEALPLVLKQVRDKNAPAYTKAQTALLLVKVGAKEHLKEIEPMLEDKTVVGNFGINNIQGQVQMRDVALAVSIKLSGQKMSDYDFDVMKGSDDLILTSYIYCAFSSEEKREDAHKKYKQLLAKSKK